MAKTLDDIFESDDLGLLDVKSKVNLVKTDEDRLVDTFMEINSFVDKKNESHQTRQWLNMGFYQD